MQKGFNSDVSVRGIVYHIQTEDWGDEKSTIVTRVFRSGAVFKTVKTPYEEILKSGPVQDQQAIVLAMKRQHHRIIEEIQNPPR